MPDREVDACTHVCRLHANMHADYNYPCMSRRIESARQKQDTVWPEFGSSSLFLCAASLASPKVHTRNRRAWKPYSASGNPFRELLVSRVAE